MDFGKLTIKSQEALRNSQEMAIAKNNNQVDVFHLLYFLILQKESAVSLILKKMEQDPLIILKELDKKINEIPKNLQPDSGQLFISSEMIMTLNLAEQESKKIGDEYISTEHLFLALLFGKNKARFFLEEKNLNYEKVLKILSQVRGGQKVDSLDPESKFQAIKKYAINLTD